ncbi:MAG: hypothetical protein U0704_02625 [Candidatus Eisenbacteria bacterium]
MTLAILDDLFFIARLQATAQAASAPLTIVPPARALEAWRETRATHVLVDLHAPLELEALVAGIRAESGGSHVRITGFYSHVDQATRTRAMAAGVDAAMPRSAFVTKLPTLLAAGTDPNPTETRP